MFEKIHKTQSQLENKVTQLKKSQEQTKQAQSQLVHSAKMASLGQLVAGVAHELNNPIGFIYSNMQHLKEYSEKLIHLVKLKTDQKNKKLFEEKKSEIDFDYIVKDLPKLIQACEEGSKRTRNIVLGLRQFSGSKTESLQQADIHEGINNTLNLLKGELLNKIKVIKKYDSLPKINCKPNQLNQVFMNILSNAIQAIKIPLKKQEL